MAVYVLVHGGAHGDRNHLLSGAVDLETHVTDVTNLMQFEDLRDVILVGHSYAGMVITDAADREADRVAELVYLDAAMPEDGEALIDWSSGLVDLAKVDAKTVEGVELVLWLTPIAFQIYGVEYPQLMEWMRPKLTPHPWKCFTQPLHLSDSVWSALERLVQF